jgi:hypothetical protein
VDFGKVAVNHISDPDNPGEYLPDTTYQYQPVLALNRAVYSNGRLQQLRLHAALLCVFPFRLSSRGLTIFLFRRRATETADTISSHWQATSSLVSAQAHVYQLSDSMLHELQMLQASTASLSVSFQNTATTTVQPYIPPHVQEAFADLSQNLSDTAAEFSLTLATKDLPLEEKATKIASDVRERIMPLLGRLTKALGDILQKPGSSTPAATADGGAGSVNENKSDRDSGGAQAAAGNAQSSK